MPESWTNRSEGAETWTAFDVVGHLIQGERSDWIPRARRILESGESRPFEPFDRNAQERESRGKTIDELLDSFARERAATEQGHSFGVLSCFKSLHAVDSSRVRLQSI